MTIRDVIGIQATGNNTTIQLFIELSIGRHNGTINDRLTDDFMDPLNAIGE